jgi:hypothetical protein
MIDTPLRPAVHDTPVPAQTVAIQASPAASPPSLAAPPVERPARAPDWRARIAAAVQRILDAPWRKGVRY